MSDELNVWRDACDLSSYRPLPSASTPDTIAAAVIRDYGDRRDADAYRRGKLEGARLALDEMKRVVSSAYAERIRALDPAKIVGEG